MRGSVACRVGAFEAGHSCSATEALGGQPEEAKSGAACEHQRCATLWALDIYDYVHCVLRPQCGWVMREVREGGGGVKQ